MASTAVQIAHSFSAELRVKVLPWRDWSSVLDSWRELVERCPRGSHFVITDWVATWLASSLEPTLVHFYDGESTLVGACLVVERSVRKGPFTIRRIYLNASGDEDDDSPRDMQLCEPGFEREMAASLRRSLSRRRVVGPWDELCVPGLVEGEWFAALAEAFGDLAIEEQTHWITWRQPNLKMRALGAVERANVPIREWAYRTMRGPKPA